MKLKKPLENSKGFHWDLSGWQDSNLRPSRFQRDAITREKILLPKSRLSLFIKIHNTSLDEIKKAPRKFEGLLLGFVGMARFELATSWSQTRRDNRATLHPER
jgi:hypothetical protein